MNLSDSFYVALCMTVLILGVVYWFWTQNQYILRKVNLLENIVFEIRSELNKDNVPDLMPATYPPAPASVLGEDEDLLHETLHAEVESTEELKEEEQTLHYTDAEENATIHAMAESISDDLQPGGVGSGLEDAAPSQGSVLESMTLKELRRLAEQRGINGTASMRKPALIATLRATKVAPSITPFESAVDLS